MVQPSRLSLQRQRQTWLQMLETRRQQQQVHGLRLTWLHLQLVLLLVQPRQLCGCHLWQLLLQLLRLHYQQVQLLHLARLHLQLVLLLLQLHHQQVLQLHLQEVQLLQQVPVTRLQKQQVLQVQLTRLHHQPVQLRQLCGCQVSLHLV